MITQSFIDAVSSKERQCVMVTESFTEGEENFLVLTMNEQRVIRKAVSDVSSEFERYKLSNELETLKTIDEELKQAECKCCGMKEECTETYILEIERSFSGNWVCGLCSEAVKERMMKFPNTTIHEALNIHKDICINFNTTRLNPKLSLTTSMREIARRSSEKRNSNNSGGSTKLARSISCDPRFGLKN